MQEVVCMSCLGLFFNDIAFCSRATSCIDTKADGLSSTVSLASTCHSVSCTCSSAWCLTCTRTLLGMPMSTHNHLHYLFCWVCICTAGSGCHKSLQRGQCGYHGTRGHRQVRDSDGQHNVGRVLCQQSAASEDQVLHGSRQSTQQRSCWSVSLPCVRLLNAHWSLTEISSVLC